MERLSLRDNHFYIRDPIRSKPRQSPYQPPRLPTPEDSRSSLEGSESDYPLEPMPEDAAKAGPPCLQTDGQQVYRENRRRAAPQSPPYEVVDESKPLLPPLKIVLGESMSSPPRTPLIRSALTQPAPREPVYTTGTYKPPSLYPNKKQKTEVLEPVPPFAPVSFAAPRSTGFDPPVRTSLPTNVSFSASHSPSRPSLTRRQSNHRPDPLCQARSPPRSLHVAIQSSYDTPPASAPLVRPAPQHASTEPIPLSASSVQPTFYGSSEKRPHSSDVRRFSTSAFDGLQYYPADDQRARNDRRFMNDQYRSPTAEDQSRLNRPGQFQRIEREPYQSSQEFNHSPFQASQPVDTYAPAYEYYYTKSRKRSNLPKHSTEIMRAWFDQNIGNPYPSEDQKAIFANATGISLTQVSNWFINHRRRCPELRDKRVERRKP